MRDEHGFNIDGWVCQICKRFKEDHFIAVLTYKIDPDAWAVCNNKIDPDAWAVCNIRYCKDNTICKYLALIKSLTGTI